MLRLNQINAIEESIKNDFQSGIHAHATGTGKSWIAMNIIKEYNKKYPTNNVLWICEKKSILIEQFDKKIIKKRNFDELMKNFNVLNFAENKLNNWIDGVNSALYWNKPVLLIINRAFITSKNNYKKIRLMFHLVIHDECHTLNNTTKQFYEYIHIKNSIKCIGFSATPMLGLKPYDYIISSYSIYDAYVDNVIVKPKIKWLTYQHILEYEDIIQCIKYIMDDTDIYYKKIIIWCGMISLCMELSEIVKKYFEDYLICIDTSLKKEQKNDYDDFCNAENKSILFCANKHREGSDIKNLDVCIFLDKVQNRCPKLFIQCIGRVLRYNPYKKFGLIIDIRAKNSYTICNHINNYLQLKDDIYPWNYNYETIKIKDDLIKINTLEMIKCEKKDKINKDNDYKYTIDDLKNKFIRNIPNENIYLKRLNEELELLHKKNVICYLIQSMDILKITKNLPHVTRGSCGSSLVCYLLGISHIDPIKYNIKFARFLNEYRNSLPDIDLDFPHNMRDEVFIKIQLKWPNKVARISNHVYFHEKSALRQAIRNAGIRKFIGKNEINKELKLLSQDVQEKIIEDKNKLENTFRCYSLHCGGIIYFPDGIPKDLILKNDKKEKRINILQQIIFNKEDVAKEKNFKIDILSSRALSQCYEINDFNLINFEDFIYDEKTFLMLQQGANIGITLGESPLIRKAFIKIKPKNIYDIALCLSIIRPAAKDAKNSNDFGELNNHIIFDDDAIDIIAKQFHLDDATADKYRKGFTKGSKEIIQEFKNLVSYLPKEEQRLIMKKFSNLARYGFCKSHALSYAQLIYKLAYMKSNNPKKFWESTLNNCVSSYRKWVHLYEAKLAGVDITKIKKTHDISIYALNRRKKIELYSPYEQLYKYGYWNMIDDHFFPNCYLDINDDIYEFNGIIASYRLFHNKNEKNIRLFIGVQTKKYIQVNIPKLNFFNSKFIGIKGKGKALDDIDKLCDIIEAFEFIFY